MRRREYKSKIAVLALSAALTQVLLSGCSELGLNPDSASRNQARDARISKLEKDSGEIREQLQSILEEQRKQVKDLEMLTARISSLADRTVAQLEAAERSHADQNKQFDTMVSQGRGYRGALGSPKTESAPECRWLGRRILLVLLRDDLIAADGFTRFYATLGCPIDYIGPVFACVNPSAQTPPGQNLEAQIDYCWQEARKRPPAP